MKPYALTPYPMTPPDDPPEPVLDDALPCPECGYIPIVVRYQGALLLRCDQNHLQGWGGRNLEKGIEYWNAAVEERKGENLKAEGVATVAENNADWMDAVEYAITLFAKTGNTFTVEDVRKRCERAHVRPTSPNAWGAAFSVAAKQGLIVRCGYTKNHLASAHARVVAVWKGKS